MTTATSILASLTVAKSGKHTHHSAQGYFLCPNHQNDRLVAMPADTAVTCSKCIKRKAVLVAQAAAEQAA